LCSGETPALAPAKPLWIGEDLCTAGSLTAQKEVTYHHYR